MREGSPALGLTPVWLTAGQASQKHNSWGQDPSVHAAIAPTKLGPRLDIEGLLEN